MMLYEAVQFQRSENYYNNYTSKIKETKPKVQRTKSATNVQRLLNQHQQEGDLSRRGSFVIGQKLRESKWFTHEELRVFCAVIETGFIVQRKDDQEEIEYGIAVWDVGQEKSKNPDHINIYSLYPHKDNFRVKSFLLFEFWPEGTKLRIFNQSDKTENPHSEDVIKDQISYSEQSKQKWHSSEHFTYWCRYGPVQLNHRVRNMTDAKWGNFGINAGLTMLKKRLKRMTSHSTK
ncbi:PREDICTED: uncharacterized protein LOC108566944 [Nicrophorus vespilloides]|uniref:Uncharacterized protein LOC108566944 n=1 Tax=Nicrophorus vespilloides TaxID=110193 RepID=A0ABM1N6X9_NICVS|nr:PREDICTED: uncharacterized protein LOC108566944 [Nicrophorus vespilloides]